MDEDLLPTRRHRIGARRAREYLEHRGEKLEEDEDRFSYRLPDGDISVSYDGELIVWGSSEEGEKVSNILNSRHPSLRYYWEELTGDPD